MVIRILVFMFLAIGASAQENHQWLIQGDNSYKSGNFNQAEEAYKKANESKSEVKSQYNLGNSVYNQERFEEAIDYYQGAVSKALTPEQKSKALYNLGNAHYMAQQYDKSIDAFKGALKINPDDLDAKKNLSLAQQQLLMQQQQREEQQNQQEGEKSDEQQEGQQPQEQQDAPEDQDSEQQEGSPQEAQESDQPPKEQTSPEHEDIGKEEAERLLRIMEQEDLKVQEKLRRSSGRKNKSNKEW